jgi:predicted nucleotidyltransferase
LIEHYHGHMDLSNPISSVSPSAHGAVLTVLARTDRSLSGRRTAELVGSRAVQSRVNSILRSLTEAGVVLCEEHPPAKLYRLNRQHVAAEAIVALANLRDELLARMRGHLSAWPVPPTAAWLFGSAARGDGGPQSDIDILVIRPDHVGAEHPDWADQLESLTAAVTAWSGNGCTVIEYSNSEFDELVAGGERLVSDIRRDGIHLAGGQITRRCRVKTGR